VARLSARILLDEVSPTCDPLELPTSSFIAPGLLVVTCSPAPIESRSVEEPAHRGRQGANAGGRTGLQLAHLGIKALIIEDEPLNLAYGSYT